ncbi:MAG: hypothetical protein LBU26_01900, partial [Synergistaceae bacterium]|nr:hypothetical protein [Synergistaceae bacterium]
KSAPPDLSGLSLIRSKENIHEYASNDDQFELRKIFVELSRREDISDIEIRKAPIEDVIAGIYLNESGKYQRAPFLTR